MLGHMIDFNKERERSKGTFSGGFRSRRQLFFVQVGARGELDCEIRIRDVQLTGVSTLAMP